MDAKGRWKARIRASMLVALGFVAGAMAALVLCRHASFMFVRVLESTYLDEEEVHGAVARKHGDWNQAVHHYANVVAVRTKPGLAAFDAGKQEWPLAFPFAALVLRQIDRTTERGLMSERVRKDGTRTYGHEIIEAVTRSPYADALEHAGRTDEAAAQYDEIARLRGFPGDRERARQFAIGIANGDEGMCDREEKFPKPE